MSREPSVAAALGRSWGRAITAWPALAGIGYAAAWLAGLSVFSSSTTVNSAGTQVVAGYTGHQAVATAQFALTEGLAAVCLAAVAAAIGRAGKSVRPLRVVAVAGAAAAVISLAQCAIGVYLVNSAVPAGHAAAAWASLPLLLVWVTGTGIALGRRGRPARGR